MTFTSIPCRFRRTSLCIGMLLTSACVSNVEPARQPELLALPGERALPLDAAGMHWLSVGEKTGIQIVARDGQLHDGWQRTAEFLDHRLFESAEQARRIFASFDTSRIELLLYSIAPDTLALNQEFISNPIDYAVEGLCLYQDSDARLHVFLLDEAFQAHQYLLLPATDAKWSMHSLRTLPIGPATEHCTVQDETHTLFVSEAAQSVWSLDANPEAELERNLIDLAAPWGSLGQGPLGLTASANALYLVNGDGPTLHSLRGTDNDLAREQMQLPMSAVEPLNSIVHGQTLHLTAFDESTGQFAHVQLDAPAASVAPDVLPVVSPSVETSIMPQGGDAADDPAVWVNSQNASQSLILGTNKRQGLFVYSLDGRQVQQLDVGRVNNVDVRYGARWQGAQVDLAAASNRDTQSVSLFAITRSSGEVRHVSDMPTGLTGIYGLCLYQEASGQMHVFVNDEDGTYLQYSLQTSDSAWSGTLVRQFAVNSQPEGCVASDRTGRLYVGEEDVGIWTLGAGALDSVALQPVAMVGAELQDDVEGLSLYVTEEREYLLASSQGNDSYVLFDAAAPYAPLGAFRVGMNLLSDPMMDGASETDGLEVSSANLGGLYEDGILIVQDGRNVLPAENQNFKLVPWSAIRDALPH